MRTFDGVTSGWTKPTLEIESGKRSLRFDGNRKQILNYISTSDTSGAELDQPFTILVEVKVDSYVNRSNGAIISGGAVSAELFTINHFTTVGTFRAAVSGVGVNFGSSLPVSTWGIIGVVFNGSTSLVISPSGVVTATSFPTTRLKGIRLGGNTNSGAVDGTTFAGNIAQMRIETRAMSEAELVAAWQAMAA
ncbi:MAG: LamG-like jellyroll fold domain-containing protein [Paracoccus aminovorans]|nr:LamG-like jellyroll fold domain-containing protein [Paracoccus aminovorans]